MSRSELEKALERSTRNFERTMRRNRHQDMKVKSIIEKIYNNSSTTQEFVSALEKDGRFFISSYDPKMTMLSATYREYNLDCVLCWDETGIEINIC